MCRTIPLALSLASVGLLFAGCESSTPTTPGAAQTAPAPGNSATSIAGLREGASHESHGAHGAQSSAALTPDMSQQIAELRRMLAPFHNFDKAVEAGYSVAAPAPGVCISDPVRGGMGYHYTRGDKDLVGDGTVSLSADPPRIVTA
jgi:hypothetical protein